MSSISPPRSDRPAVAAFGRLVPPIGCAGRCGRIQNVGESRPARAVDTRQSRRNARPGAAVAASGDEARGKARARLSRRRNAI